MRIYTSMCIHIEMEEKSTEALSFVKQNPGCKVSDVQKYLGVSRPVVATIVKSLEELGFVEKKQGKGRATALFVTQKGEEFLKPKEGAVSAGTVTGVEAPSAIPVQPAASPVVARAAPQAQVTEAVPSDVKPAQKTQRARRLSRMPPRSQKRRPPSRSPAQPPRLTQYRRRGHFRPSRPAPNSSQQPRKRAYGPG